MKGFALRLVLKQRHKGTSTNGQISTTATYPSKVASFRGLETGHVVNTFTLILNSIQGPRPFYNGNGH